MPASVSVMLSTTKPAGMSDETGKFLAMLLIPFRKQHHLSTKYHQECQFALNCEPLFASNRDPSAGRDLLWTGGSSRQSGG
jgi:hypothetical protein